MILDHPIPVATSEGDESDYDSEDSSTAPQKRKAAPEGGPAESKSSKVLLSLTAHRHVFTYVYWALVV